MKYRMKGAKLGTLKIALVNLNKPHDVAITMQLAMAFRGLEIFSIGTTMDPNDKKVRSKLASWTVDMATVDTVAWERIESLDALTDRGFNLVSTSPCGGSSLFEYEIGDKDVFVIGGAAGLSRVNLAKCKGSVTIPCDPSVPFLTVGSVVPLIIGQSLSNRKTAE